MFRVDADTHIDETEATWEYMTAEESRFKPICVDPGRPLIAGDVRPHRFWLVDGVAGFRRWRDDARTSTPARRASLLDVPARVRQMDEHGRGRPGDLPYLHAGRAHGPPRGRARHLPKLQPLARGSRRPRPTAGCGG